MKSRLVALLRPTTFRSIGKKTQEKVIRTLCLILVFCSSSTKVLAQTADPSAIRVESNLVLVPTVVLYKNKMKSISTSEIACERGNNAAFGALTPFEPFQPKNCEEAFVADLGARNFRVFEDGIEQTVGSVSTEMPAAFPIRDNSGWHDDWSFSPRSIWSTTDLGAPYAFAGTMSVYVVSYVPKSNDEGSCHTVEVKVDRKDTAVFSRDSYCNTKHPTTDPLSGTKLGFEMQENLHSGKPGSLELHLQAGYFRSDGTKNRIAIALEFPWASLNHEWRNGIFYAQVGVLGIITSSDGKPIKRFSDMACCASEARTVVRSTNAQLTVQAHPEFDRTFLPTRYQTQIDVPPGDYVLRVILSDGTSYGVAEIPLPVESDEGRSLGMSSVFLAKRMRDAAVAAAESKFVNLAPKYTPLVSKGMQFTPTGDTCFRKGEPMIVYFEVYDSALTYDSLLTKKVPDLSFEIRISDSKTSELKSDTGTRSAAPWIQMGNGVVAISEQVAVERLKPGNYTLEVQASDSAGNTTAWRSASFSVE